MGTTEAARYLTTNGVTVSDQTLRRWADEKRIVHLRMPSGQLRFRRADLDVLLTPIQPDAREAS